MKATIWAEDELVRHAGEEITKAGHEPKTVKQLITTLFENGASSWSKIDGLPADVVGNQKPEMRYLAGSQTLEYNPEVVEANVQKSYCFKKDFISMISITEQIIYIGQRSFERKLFDMAGGNISVRDGNRIHITARYSGSKRHWQNQSEDILVADIGNDKLLDDPRCSRESNAHLAIYRHFPDVGAIIHAHAFHILPFCSASRPIEPVLEQTQKFGMIKVVEFAPAHTAELAKNIVEGLAGQEATIKKQAAAVLLPRHGIIVAGKDLLAAADAVERIDWNAWCILARQTLAVR